MKYKLAIFDLDGTILNTLDDLADSLNHVLHSHSLPTHSLEEVRAMVGNGIANLIARAVPVETPTDLKELIYKDFMKYYSLHCADKTRPYEGILQLIKDLKELECKTAVVSNKANSAVKILCDKYFPGLFDFTVGEQPEISKKPAPDMVNLVISNLDVRPDDAVYIGDSEVDIKTASNSNMDGIIVSWGFRNVSFLQEKGAKTIAYTPADILELIK